MIEMPQRSVTRFFVPLIDVLILLFCIFLLLPFVSAPADPSADPNAPTDVEELRTRLKAAEDELVIKRKRENELLAEYSDTARRTVLLVLTVHPVSGQIAHTKDNGTVVRIKDVNAAADFIREAERKPGVGSVKYQFVMAADEKRNYPDATTTKNIREWFSGKSVEKLDLLELALK